jgi:hypothetical protein
MEMYVPASACSDLAKTKARTNAQARATLRNFIDASMVHQTQYPRLYYPNPEDKKSPDQRITDG